MKILIVVHGHPRIRKGGGEIAAYNQFLGLKKLHGSKVNFLAHAEDSRLFNKSGAIISFKDNEYLFNSKYNGQFLTSNDADWLNSFCNFLEKTKPDVVHFHHYFKAGLEAISAVKSTLGPSVKIIVTLHEFLAICQNDGQMIKANGNPCPESSIIECTLCSQHRTLTNTLIREVNLKNTFAKVDKFISPSRFLLDRYTHWGIPCNKIVELENGYPHKKSKPVERIDGVVTFAFFGQFTPYKGVDLFCEAALMVKNKLGSKVNFLVYGAQQQSLADQFTKRIDQLKTRSENIVTFMGGYDDSVVVELMKAVDWVVVPSKWWENSPVIVDEALSAQTPLLVANHGGLYEKVVSKGFGVGFTPNSAASLAERFIGLTTNTKLRDDIRKVITEPRHVDDVAVELSKIYQDA